MASRSWTIASLVSAAAGIRASSTRPGSGGRPARGRRHDRDVAVGGHPADDRDRAGPSARRRPGPRPRARAGRSPASAPATREIITSNGAMPGSRRGIASRSTRIPVPARSAVSEVAQLIPPAPRSWRPSTRPRSISSSDGLDQQLLGERVADLDGRPLRRIVVGEGRAGQDRRPADPVAAGRRAEQDDEVARARAPAARVSRPVRQQADRHDVDERVAGVATDRRRARRRPSARRRSCRSRRRRATTPSTRWRVRGVGRIAEAQGVEDGDRPGAHREDVAQDPADAGRRALVRLDRATDGCATRS